MRDGVLDHDGVSTPCMAAPLILPSALGTASASVTAELSRLNIPPQIIAVYPSWPTSPAVTQHSLPGGRYPLPGPDSHRLDQISLS